MDDETLHKVIDAIEDTGFIDTLVDTLDEYTRLTIYKKSETLVFTANYTIPGRRGILSRTQAHPRG